MTRKDARTFPLSHREPADFAGVAVSVSKTEIATKGLHNDKLNGMTIPPCVTLSEAKGLLFLLY